MAPLPSPKVYNPAAVRSRMDRQQIIAIIFVLLMIGSSIAYGVAVFL
jgi:hypothetical protein